MGFLSRLFRGGQELGKSKWVIASDGAWQAKMGWRWLVYMDGVNTLSIALEPMVAGPDVVCVPNETDWQASAPDWARARRSEILERLKSVPWEREITWSQGSQVLADDLVASPIPGSLEDTPGGRALEAAAVFHPDGLGHKYGHSVWHLASAQHAAAAKGDVTIFASEVEPGSVFAEIVLPALKANSQAKIRFVDAVPQSHNSSR